VKGKRMKGKKLKNEENNQQKREIRTDKEKKNRKKKDKKRITKNEERIMEKTNFFPGKKERGIFSDLLFFFTEKDFFSEFFFLEKLVLKK
jgi:hypothetical protein